MKKITLALALAGTFLLNSCDMLNQVADQFVSVANLVNCDFSLKNVSNVTVAGVNVKNVTNGNLTAADVLKLVAAYNSKKVPLGMDVNVDITNPTSTKAAMTALDWILAIDGTDLASGVNSQGYTIKPSATTTVPLGVSADLADLFSKQGIDALKTFASSFTSEGVSSKVGLRVKPSMSVGTATVPFPDYIKLEKKTGTTTTPSTPSSPTLLKSAQ
ncbi:MAG: LEA type 2 family protein [Bacteroidales bacterium]|nr:LEA type 2 family protein [Bacteroidales bacterium]